MSKMSKRSYQIHRKLSVWLALPVILWAVSGILHPIMANWFRPSIAKTFLVPKPIPKTENLLAPSKVFPEVDELHQLKLISLTNEPVYLGITPDENWHFRSALSGELLPNADLNYAEQLARAYADDQTSLLKNIEILTEFDSTYGVINRLLPAYRVALDRPDGLEVVVDPRTGRLATFDTPAKRAMSRTFRWLHTWSFLGKPESKLRITCVLIVSVLALGVALSGLVSLLTIKRSRLETSRRSWHRILGGVTFVFYFLFGLSGLAHVAAKYNYDDTTSWVSAQKISTLRLSRVPDPGFSKLSLAVIHDRSYYRTVRKEGVTYSDTETGLTLKNGEEIYAKELALEFSNLQPEQIEKVEPIMKFQPDYGFIFKRLPVQRVHYKDASIISDAVDTEDAHMAMRTTPGRLVEALSFTYLHKFHFLDFAGRNTRDALSAIAAGLLALTALSGILLYHHRR